MASGQTVILASARQRQLAHQLIDKAPDRAVLNIRAESRTGDQNARLWSALSDISRAKPEGRVMTPDTWKAIMMSALGHAVQFEPGLDGLGVVPVGFRSSRLTKAQFSALLNIAYEYGERHGVKWSEPQS